MINLAGFLLDLAKCVLHPTNPAAAAWMDQAKTLLDLAQILLNLAKVVLDLKKD